MKLRCMIPMYPFSKVILSFLSRMSAVSVSPHLPLDTAIFSLLQRHSVTSVSFLLVYLASCVNKS